MDIKMITFIMLYVVKIMLRNLQVNQVLNSYVILQIYIIAAVNDDKTRLVLSFRYVPETPLYDLSDWAKKFNKSAKLTV